MGLFRKPADEAPMSTAEALAGIATCAVYADGVMSADEDEQLSQYLQRLAPFRGLSARELSAIFQDIHRSIDAEGESVVLAECARALPDRMRPTAFLVAADLVMTDGDIGDEETAFLEAVRVELRMEPAAAQKVLDVLALKHVS